MLTLIEICSLIIFLNSFELLTVLIYVPQGAADSEKHTQERREFESFTAGSWVKQEEAPNNWDYEQGHCLFQDSIAFFDN